MDERCRTCGYFESNPKAIEQAFPGLTILSSAYGSARGDAGLCLKHDLWLSQEEACDDYHPRTEKHP